MVAGRVAIPAGNERLAVLACVICRSPTLSQPLVTHL
jgi:hypothetical protein